MRKINMKREIVNIRNHSVKGGKMTGERAGAVFGETLWRHL
jgi:hypothetical protein